VWDVARDLRPLAEWQAVAKRCSYLLASDHHGPVIAAIGSVVGAAIGAVVAAGESARAQLDDGGGAEPEREADEEPERARAPQRQGALERDRGSKRGSLDELVMRQAARQGPEQLAPSEAREACERCGHLSVERSRGAAHAYAPDHRSNAVADALALAVEELARCVDARTAYDPAQAAAALDDDEDGDEIRATG
jgi:hypothetical protein